VSVSKLHLDRQVLGTFLSWQHWRKIEFGSCNITILFELINKIRNLLQFLHCRLLLKMVEVMEQEQEWDEVA
jgi:hypothetical protein